MKLEIYRFNKNKFYFLSLFYLLIFSSIIVVMFAIISINKSRVKSNLIISKNGNIEYRIIAQDIRVARNNNLIVETMLKKYILNREKIDMVTELERYEHNSSLHNVALQQNFLKNQKNIYRKLIGEKIKRNVEIKDVKKISKSVYQFRVIFFDYYSARLIGLSTINSIENTITMKIGFADNRINLDEQLLNPIGLVIMEYNKVENKKNEENNINNTISS